MAGPAFVTGQQGASSASGTNVSVTLPSAITAGNMLVAIAATDDANVPPATGVTDTSGSNVWTRIVTQARSASGGGIGLFVCLSAAGGSYPIKFTHTGSFVAESVAEYSPNGQSGNDGTAAAASNTTGTPNPGTVTTANANDVILSGASDASADVTWSAGASFALRGNVTSSANTTVALQDRTVSATSGYASAFGNSATTLWVAVAAAIKAVASGAPAAARPLVIGQSVVGAVSF